MIGQQVKQKVDHLIEYLSRLFLVLSGAMIVGIVLCATYGVIRRYAFNSPEPYSYELSIIFLLLCFVFAVADLEKTGRHIRVDIVSARLPEGAQAILLNIVGPILGLFACSILTWKSWDVAMFSLRIGEVSTSIWAVPLFPVKIAVPVGFGLLCLVLLTKIYRGIASLKGGAKKVSSA